MPCCRSAITKVQGVVIAIIAVIIVAALVSGIYYYYTSIPTPTPPPPEKIKIGMIASLSGGLATVGRLQKITIEEAVKMINSEGGVFLKQYRAKVPIELIIYDDESNPARATELAGRLAAEGVVAVICCSYAHIVTPAAKVTERYGIPLLNGGTPIEFVAAAGPWNYTWSYGMSYKKIIDDFLAFLEGYKNRTNMKFAVILSDDIIGRTQKTLLVPELEKRGYSMFVPDLYPPGTTDFTALITKMKEEKCEILWMHGTAPTFATFWRQCLALGYKPKIIYQSGGLARLEEVQALGGDLALGVITFLCWHYDYPFPMSKTFREIWTKYLVEKNIDLSPVAAYYFTVPFILKDALERAGSLDREALNKAIGETKMIGAPGPVSFDSVTHVGTGYMCLGQWMKTEYGTWILQPIWSKEVPEVKTVEPIFPLP